MIIQRPLVARSRAICIALATSAACSPPPENVVADDSGSTSTAMDTTAGDDDSGTTTTSDDGDTTNPDGTSDAESSGSSTDDTGEMLVLYGGVVRSLGAGATPRDAPVLAGAEVCATTLDPPPCTTSDDAGAWSLMLPPDDDALAIDIVADGHLGIRYVTFTTGEDNVDHTVWLPDDEVADAFYASCGAAYPESEGAVVLSGFSLVEPAMYEYLEGGTASAVAGVGPCYMASPWEHDPAQTSTSAAGWGSVVFANVPIDAPDVDVTISSEGQTCASFEGLVDTRTPNVVRVPVAAGLITVVDIVCEG